MFIARITSVSNELVHAFERLVPQLNLSLPPPKQDELEHLVSSEASILLAARFPDESAEIAGVLTLIVYRVPTGIRAHIEDVVVDGSLRGNGIGEALVRYALNMARDTGADGVALTSNPKRKAANRLYQRLGFKIWRTNLYYFKF